MLSGSLRPFLLRLGRRQSSQKVWKSRSVVGVPGSVRLPGPNRASLIPLLFTQPHRHRGAHCAQAHQDIVRCGGGWDRSLARGRARWAGGREQGALSVSSISFLVRNELRAHQPLMVSVPARNRRFVKRSKRASILRGSRSPSIARFASSQQHVEPVQLPYVLRRRGLRDAHCHERAGKLPHLVQSALLGQPASQHVITNQPANRFSFDRWKRRNLKFASLAF